MACWYRDRREYIRIWPSCIPAGLLGLVGRMNRRITADQYSHSDCPSAADSAAHATFWLSFLPARSQLCALYMHDYQPRDYH